MPGLGHVSPLELLTVGIIALVPITLFVVGCGIVVLRRRKRDVRTKAEGNA